MHTRKPLGHVVGAALAVSGLLAAATASALPVQTQGRAWIQVFSVNIYDIAGGPDSNGEFRFYNADRQLRGLTTIDVDSVSAPTGVNLRQQLQYTVLPDLPVLSDSRSDATSSQYGDIQGTYIDAGCTVTALDTSCTGSGGVSTTATGTTEPGFWNLIIGPHTAVEMTATSFVEVWLRETCLLTCGNIFASAELFAQFGPESTVDPGLPILGQLVTRRARNTLVYDASNFGNTGGLFHDFRGQDLRLVFENRNDFEVMGRIRWQAQVVGESAQVPEPGSLALLGLGIGLLAVRRRRAAA